MSAPVSDAGNTGPGDARGLGMADEFPASFAQQRLWFLGQYEGQYEGQFAGERDGAAATVYNIRLPVRLSGPLRVDLLQQALDQVVDRHESLRTLFANRGGEAVQRVLPQLAVPLVLVEAGATDPESLRNQVATLAGEPFDLAAGPLIRAPLLRIAPDDHVLVLVLHHIIGDAWSSGILCRDLAAAYDALVRGAMPSLPPLDIQYADYAVWQREWLKGAELEQQLRWWRDHLDGAPAVLALPTDRPRPPLQTFRGSRLSRTLPPARLKALKAAAGAAGATLYMFLLAGFATLLARRSGQDDLVVGTPIAGRRRRELEDLIGLFANTLALRVRTGEAATFRELLAQVRATALGAFAHQDLPFEKLVEALKPPRDLSHSPVFQVFFALQNTPWEAASWGGLVASPAEMSPSGTARYDLSLSAVEYEGELWLNFEYNTDLFDAATVDRWARGLDALLAAVTAAPDLTLAEVPVMDAAEEALVLRAWNRTAVPLPAANLWGFVSSMPAGAGATAVEWKGGRWSYAELFRHACELAGRLRAAGAGPGSTVALAGERSPWLLAGLLAVLRTGARYLPLDPRHPPARLSFILEDAEAGFLLADGGLAEQLAGFAGTVLVLGEADEVAPVPATDCPGVAPATADGDAYLIYTSGSTGRPKGVRVGQGAVVNFLSAMGRLRADGGGSPASGLLQRGERLLAVTTVSFDIAVLELLLPLTVGATVVLADADTAADALALRRWLESRDIHVMQATPATWRGLLAAGWRGGAGFRALCGGEGLEPDLAAALLTRCGELWNLYGPTETTVWSCGTRVQAVPEPAPASLPVGGPIANTRSYVLDPAGRPVPVGTEGELWIGGAGVAAGYHQRPELTADRFRPDPFREPADPGDRIYGTGDRARWRADGSLEIRGRTDFQFKLRGFRIEPGEIEAALRACAGVAEAAVFLAAAPGTGGTPSPDADRRLAAWVVPVPGLSPDPATWAAELKAALRNRLPDWQVPAFIGFLPALPRTPNGKLDRNALPPPDWALPGSGATVAVTAPRDPREEALAALMAEVLGLPNLDIHADFFALGGHSLLATRLVARVRDALGVELPLKRVFQTPTVAGLAPVVAELAGAAGLPAITAVATAASAPASASASASGEPAPLSLVQQRLWFLDRLQPGNSVYHLVWAVNLAGPVNDAALSRAIAMVVARHDSLRTRFVTRDGEAWQVVSPATTDSRLPALGIETVAAGSLEERLKGLVHQPFDLARGPLVRFALLRESGAPDAAVLAVVIHHIIADGWSLAVLFNELGAAYSSALAGREDSGLAPLPLQYPQWARWQREWLAGGEQQRQLHYWQQQLAGAPLSLDLWGARPRPPASSHRGARQGLRVPATLHQSLRNLARDRGCTLYTVLLAAFGLVLARYAGREEVLVGTPVAGRPRTELEGLIGFFVNTLVMRVDLRGDPTVAALLARVRAMTLDAWSHADVPFEQLVEVLRPPRDTGRSPLFQVMFNFHTEPAGRLELPGVTVQPRAVARDTAKFDLTASLAETAAGIAVSLEYSTDLFHADWAREFGERYLRTLEDFTATADNSPGIAQVGLHGSAAEGRAGFPHGDRARHQLRAACGRTVAQAFADRAAAAPDAVAVAWDDGPWTFADLAARAGGIAAALKELGIGPGQRVALWCGQGPGAVAAMLGVAAAGAAWLPLDPAGPPERRRQLLAAVPVAAVLVDGATASPPDPAETGDLPRLDLGQIPLAPFSPAAVPPDAPAYLLQTSGTTGNPVLVEQSHRALLHHVLAWSARLHLGPADRLGLCTRYNYDSAIQDIFGGLLCGASLAPLDLKSRSRDEILAALAAGITVFHGTPTVFRHLFGGGQPGGLDHSRLRLVVLGGEAAREADLALARKRLTAARFVNGYGLTEATAVLQWIAPDGVTAGGPLLPVGTPVGDIHVSLQDESGAPAAIAGELVVHSAYVGARLRATGDGVNSPVARKRAPTDGFFTGDLVRRLPDGNYLWTGRRDLQLKLGGNRVEPAEVEAALAALPGVTRCAVVARADDDGEPALAAFLEGDATVAGADRELRRRLAGWLPAFAVPARFQWLPSLPELPNGKVDRQALLALPLAKPRPAAVEVSAGEDTLAVLRSLWLELLPGAEPDADTDFFLAGGHSLLAMRFIARIREHFGVDLPLLRFFEAPRLGALAASVERLAAAPALTTGTAPIPVRSRRPRDRSGS